MEKSWDLSYFDIRSSNTLSLAEMQMANEQSNIIEIESILQSENTRKQDFDMFVPINP